MGTGTAMPWGRGDGGDMAPHLSAAASGTTGPGLPGLSPTEELEKLLEPERGGSGGFSSSPSARERGGRHGTGGHRDPRRGEGMPCVPE